MTTTETRQPDALLIKVDGTIEPLYRDGRRWLDVFYTAIECHTVDVVGTEFGDLWIDDEGLLVAEPQLNPIASALASRPLAGHAVLTGGADDEGETLPVDPVIAEKLTAIFA